MYVHCTYIHMLYTTVCGGRTPQRLLPRKRPAESSALRPLMADGLSRSPLEKMNEAAAAAAAANGLSEAVERR